MNPANPTPLVTVVIPVFNQKIDFLRQCIDSILEQDYPNLEIIVSDNHSDNGCWEAISDYTDCRLKVIRPPLHLPMVQHWAFAAYQAKGEYLSLMGSDDWAQPNWLSAIMTEVAAYPTASFAFSNLTLHSVKTGSLRTARDQGIPTQLIPSVDATRQVVEWTSHMFSWWVVGAVIRSRDYFAVSGIARYATVHNGDYPLSLGLLTKGDALYIGRALVNYRLWSGEEGKADGRRQAVILEDMNRILACIETDSPVRTRCIDAGWSTRRIRRRFIMLAVLWSVPLPSSSGPFAGERKRLLHCLNELISARFTLGIMLLPVLMPLFALLNILYRVRHVLRKSSHN